jgi:long-subunit acyl-CoA synthetase (AMP-forming)
MARGSGTPRSAAAVTVAEAFRRTVAVHPKRIAIRELGGETVLTWSQLCERVDALAGGLAKLGLRRGDSVSLMLANRPEFHVADLAAMMLGAVPFSVYQTLSPEQIEYVVGDSGARVAIIERGFLEPFFKAKQSLPQLESVIVIDGEGEEGTLRLSDIEGSDPHFDVEASWRAVAAEDLLTLIYTSGTTGPPKGVQLTHRSMMAAAEAFDDLIQFPEEGRVVSWLPAAHIAERAAHHYLPIIFGLSIATCSNPREILSVLPQVRPSWFFAVPRIWEKLKAGLEARFAALPEEQRKGIEEGFRLSLRKVRLERQGKAVPEDLAKAVAAADEAIFSKLRATLGLDEAKVVSVGAAPSPPEVLEFFHAAGIEVGELWGMSETCGAGAVNPPGAIRIGTVGKPVKGVEIRLAEDGEMLVRGDCVMQGYRNLPEKTAEAIDSEGWLATGDVGEFDEDGYLRIIDRKKELIINAAGKNMSPANIENTLKVASPLIGQVCVIGDRRPFNTALIVLDADYAPSWAEKEGLGRKGLDQLASEEKIRAAIGNGVEDANQKLARVEQVKRFTVVRGDWLPGGDELTPTMKLKRRPIAEKYAREIERMYGG